MKARQRTSSRQQLEVAFDWVRTRILKGDPPPEGSLLQIAERARRMAANSLGRQHPTYAVALQNLGLYYDFIENDLSKAAEFFNEARYPS
jgi:hypothetical protein